MKTCPITGRHYRTANELRKKLAEIDAQIMVLEACERQFHVLTFASEQVTCDAWNALNDAIDRLKIMRAEVEMNPRPMRESDRAHYELVKANID